MKKSWVWMAVILLLAGCAAISTQYNLMEKMESYVFNSPPAVIFTGAREVFSKDGLPLTTTGANTGVSPWKKAYVTQGSLSHYEKIRYRVVVSSAGKNQSIVRVHKESIPDKSDPVNVGRLMGSEMLRAGAVRYIPYEYSILQFVNPAAASAMQASAASK